MKLFSAPTARKLRDFKKLNAEENTHRDLELEIQEIVEHRTHTDTTGEK